MAKYKAGDVVYLWNVPWGTAGAPKEQLLTAEEHARRLKGRDYDDYVYLGSLTLVRQERIDGKG